MTHCRVTRQKCVENSQHFPPCYPLRHLPSPVSRLPSPNSHLLSPISPLLFPISHLPSPISRLPSPTYRLQPPVSFFLTPSPPFPSSLETPTVQYSISGGRSEVDHQQEGWKMTARWGEVRLAARRGGNDRWAERGEFDQQKGWRMTI